jgi:hypothetical protein
VRCFDGAPLSYVESMPDTISDIHALRVLVCDPAGEILAREQDANTFIGAAWEHQAALIAIPVTRLTDDFFRLSTRLAGEVTQKFVNYNLRLAIVGDISRWLADSKALCDFVYEANNGQSIWFVADFAELERRLSQQAA